MDRCPGYRDPGFTGRQPPGDRPDPVLEKRTNPRSAVWTLPRSGRPDPSFPGTRAHRLVSKFLFPSPPSLTPKIICSIAAVPSKSFFDSGGKAISAKLFLRWMDCGGITKKMNIEHRTSNIEHRMGNREWGKKKKSAYDLEERLLEYSDLRFSFDVGRSMFFVRRSSFKAPLFGIPEPLHVYKTI